MIGRGQCAAAHGAIRKRPDPIGNAASDAKEIDRLRGIDNKMRYQKNNLIAGKTTGRENVGANIESN
ncbi:hypothetical protein [Herbaspirillum sp. SJZ099]|uniref:hypothetical protein n=1 Tax=Herbaspirillum sp. SJZ099 TaxID=2572916 RepID=UPI00119F2F70|nr:hypothetical protein [Herbaspirillum sp. SJZ099]